MKTLLSLSLILILYSCMKEEEYDPLAHCTTIYDEESYYFRFVNFYTEDMDGNSIILNFHEDHTTFPGIAELTLDENLNYHLILKEEKLSEDHPHLEVDIDDSGLLDFQEGEPYFMPGIMGGWTSKNLNFQFNSNDGTSTEFIETSFICDRILLTYAKRINERDSISMNFLTE